MAFSGQIIHNPVSGERIQFLRTAEDTDGACSSSSCSSRRTARCPAPTCTRSRRSASTSLEGTMKFRLGLRKIVAGPGENVVVPAGARHKFANGGDTTARVRVQVEPALDMEQLLEHDRRARPRGPRAALGHAEAAAPGAVRRALPARGPRAVPARLDGARADGAAAPPLAPRAAGTRERYTPEPAFA